MAPARRSTLTPLQHVIQNVLGLPPAAQTNLTAALDADDRTAIVDLLDMNGQTLAALRYTVVTGDASTQESLSSRVIGKIQAFLSFAVWLGRNGQHPGRDDAKWLALTEEQFIDYRMSEHYISMNNGWSASSSTSTSTTLTTARDPVSEFRRGIKRDPNLFLTLRDDKHWDSWRRSTISQARAQDVEEVLNEHYNPDATTPAGLLFKEKKKYMYAVFEKCVQTDVGQDIVREHTTDSDAQAVYQKLCKHALRSTKASLSSQSLLTYITSVRLGDGKWKGTYHSFLVNWKNQIRLYENMVSGKSRFSDEQKMIMLQNAVHPIEDLRAVKNTADQFKAQTGSEIDYHAYYRLLVSAAQQLDGTSTPAPRGVPRRHVYQHETLVHGEGFEAADGDVFYDAPHDFEHNIESAYNIDSDVQFMEVYASHSGTPRPMLPSHQWQKLSHEDKKVWSRLSDAGKRVLLGNTGSGTTTKPPPGPWQSARPPNSGFIKSNPSSAGSARKLNLHEISVADFISDQLSTLHNDASTIGDTTQAKLPPLGRMTMIFC